MGSHGNDDLSQAEVCTVCGDIGFSNALINCSDCCETLVHQYCLGIPPGSIDDSFNWYCEFCCAKKESEPRIDEKSGGASIKKGKGNSKKRKRERERERSPSNLLSEIPLTLGSKCKRIRKERTEDQSLAVITTKVAFGHCSCGKVDRKTDSDSVVDHEANCSLYCQGDAGETPDDEGETVGSPDDEDQPEPLLTLLPIAYHQGSEEEEKPKDCHHLFDPWEESEGGLSSLMENPEELTRGVVLLVSPSGEVFIHEAAGYCDAQGVLLVGSPSAEIFMDEDSG